MTQSKRSLLVLCGVSGSGKSTLEANLIDARPDLFHKWQQVSTRKPRVGERMGDPYIFVERETYHHLKDKLVGRLGLAKDTIFPELYGSIPDFVEGKISTIILAEEAILDLKNEISNGNLVIDNVFIFGLDVKFEDLNQKDLRDGRNQEFVDSERSVLGHADMVHRTSNGRYCDPKVVITVLESNGFDILS